MTCLGRCTFAADLVSGGSGRPGRRGRRTLVGCLTAGQRTVSPWRAAAGRCLAATPWGTTRLSLPSTGSSLARRRSSSSEAIRPVPVTRTCEPLLSPRGRDKLPSRRHTKPSEAGRSSGLGAAARTTTRSLDRRHGVTMGSSSTWRGHCQTRALPDPQPLPARGGSFMSPPVVIGKVPGF